jgi:hypothetical protein
MEKGYRCKYAKPRNYEGPTRVLYVAGVGDELGTALDSVRAVFAAFGELDDEHGAAIDMVPSKVSEYVPWMQSSNSLIPRCVRVYFQRFCFVVYKTVEDAQRAFAALDHVEVPDLGVQLYLRYAVEAEDRVRVRVPHTALHNPIGCHP